MIKFFMCLPNFFELWNLFSRVQIRNSFLVLIQAPINILESLEKGAQIPLSSPYFLVNPAHSTLFSLEIPIRPTFKDVSG